MIHWLESLRSTDAPHVGGKAAHLGELAAAGLPVPPGFVVATEAYEAFLAAHPELASALGDAAQEEAIKQGFYRLPLPEAVEAALGEACRVLADRLGVEKAVVAVRSSALGEDGEAASFAGQQVTFLNARGPAEVTAAMRACWAGLWSERAMRYRDRLADPPKPALAVLVQALVVPECAGVAFSVNPVTGDRDEVVIDASWGLGTAVVSGRVTPDHIRLARDGALLEYRVNPKPLMVVPDARGVKVTEVPADRRSARALTDAQLARLHALVLAVEAHYGQPQDLEWAIAGGELHLLQARPITALPPPPPPGGWAGPVAGARWERRNFAEHFPGPVSPLAESLVLSAVGAVLAGLAREVGHTLPTPAITTVHGYVYTRGDMGKRWDWPLRALRHGARLLTRSPEAWETPPGHAARLERLLLRSPDGRDPAAVVRWCEAYVAELARTWADVHRLSAGWRWSEYALRAALGGDMVGAGVLLSGFESPSTLIEGRLHRLSREAPVAAAVALAHENAWEALGALGEQTADFRARMLAFGKAGADMPASFDPAVAMPYETPEQVCKLVATSRRAGGPGPEARLAAMARDRATAAEAALQAAKGPKRALLSRLIPWAQRYARVREGAVAALGKGWRSFREALLALGAHWAEAGKLPEAEAIFMCSWDEVKAMATGAPGPEAHVLVERRALWQVRDRYTPPLVLGESAVTTGRAIAGVSASAGRYTGVARVIRGPEDFDRLAPGEVLVAPLTTPAWTPLFHLAGAIVTDVGGPLSHGSIVAREFGIPAVLGTESATRRLRDGAVVTVDGDAGVVWPGG